MGVGTWIERWADVQPAKTAIHFAGDSISYGALAQRISAMARWLADDVRVRHGDRVGFLGTNHPDCIVALFACARLGAILVPLNWRLTVSEHSYIVANAEPVALLVTSEFRQHAEALRDALGDAAPMLAAVDFAAAGWRAIDASQEGVEAPAGCYDDPLLLVYTSGTTGRPKGAVLTQNAILWNAINSIHAHDLACSDHILTTLPLFHVGGMNIQTVPALHMGATVTLAARFDAGTMLRTIAAARPTVTLLVPATAQALLGHAEWAATDLSSLRVVAMGSSIVPTPMIQAILDRGPAVTQVYGATETAPIAIYLRAADCGRVGSTGKPAIHCEAKLVDGSGKPVPPDEVGEILVRGPNIIQGYWRDDAATAEALRGGWFHTGDVGYRDAEGFWYVTDRKKDMIVSGGENIYPAELEAVLHDCPAVQECAVVARPDMRWGEIPVAVVVVKPGHALSHEAVIALYDGRLARFKRPRDVVFATALPRNAMGKILKFELRRQQAETAS